MVGEWERRLGGSRHADEQTPLGEAGGLRRGPIPILIGLLSVTFATMIGEIVPSYVSGTHVALMCLLIALVMAIYFGLWPALITAAVSVGVLDFLFLPPLYSLAVETPQDALLLLFFFVVAAIGSGLASRLRTEARVARQNADATAELCRFAGRLCATVTMQATISAAVSQIADMLGARASITFGGIVPTQTSTLVVPLRAAGEILGVMTIMPGKQGDFSLEDRSIIEALAELTGVAIVRQLLADKLARLGIEQEADRLRSVLLSAIAHDLSAPISSIASVLASLKTGYHQFEEAARHDLIKDAEPEARRLA